MRTDKGKVKGWMEQLVVLFKGFKVSVTLGFSWVWEGPVLVVQFVHISYPREIQEVKGKGGFSHWSMLDRPLMPCLTTL